MKKNFFSKLVLLLSIAIVLGSCSGLKKMKDQSSTVKYDAAPKVLEMHNGEVTASFSGNFPPKYFNKKAVVTVTPIVKYDGGQIELKPMKLQGEGVQGNDKPIPYEAGGSFSYTDKFAYKDEMMLSKVELKVTAQLKKENLELGSYAVADGIIVTPKLVRKEAKVITLSDNFVRVVPQTKVADVKFDINKADIKKAETKKAEVAELNTYIKDVTANPRVQLKGIELSSYASPDGPEDKNADLAKNREKSAKNFLKSEIKKAKIEQLKSDSLFKYLQTPEDWDGFKTMLENSDVKDKELILRVLSMYSDPVVREKEIRNISEAFEDIKEKILPQLRRSKFIVNVESIGYSDEELLQLADSNIDTLNLEELLYAGKMIQDMNKKVVVYQKAASKFPDDVRAKNNLGYALYNTGKLDEAQAALNEAKAIENSDAVKNNLGAVALMKGDTTAAIELFTSALGAGEAPNYNLGIINIMKGKYDIAVSHFGNMCDYNAALAKMLNKNYEEATSTIGCSKDESAQAYYLKAILGAKNDNADMVLNNLRTAVGKDSNLKAYAKKEAEFLKYFNDETFKSITE